MYACMLMFMLYRMVNRANENTYTNITVLKLHCMQHLYKCMDYSFRAAAIANVECSASVQCALGYVILFIIVTILLVCNCMALIVFFLNRPQLVPFFISFVLHVHIESEILIDLSSHNK